ncbi:uncharacterized protein LOC125194723 [Salvia hispanica]|uniref:uncharacterized protein LOC125194723 n=1 Tax=Salvia hispanica TaxID=49212 RepID=UPI0020090A1E|nr:uncharacterized protein LOC125194723 [Salvia hispanica]
MSSSSSQSYGSSFNWNWPCPESVNCNHDLEAELVISRTTANPGRRYYRCPICKEDDCRFFRWVDVGLSPSQDTYFQKIKLERDNFEEQLRCNKIMEGVLEEKLRLKTDEFEEVKLKLSLKSEECVRLKLQIDKATKVSRNLKIMGQWPVTNYDELQYEHLLGDHWCKFSCYDPLFRTDDISGIPFSCHNLREHVNSRMLTTYWPNGPDTWYKSSPFHVDLQEEALV